MYVKRQSQSCFKRGAVCKKMLHANQIYGLNLVADVTIAGFLVSLESFGIKIGMLYKGYATAGLLIKNEVY